MANILIVDDQPDAALSVRVFLEKRGHTVACVLNGREPSRVC